MEAKHSDISAIWLVYKDFFLNPPVGSEFSAPKKTPNTVLFGLKFDTQTEGLGMCNGPF